MYGSHNTTPAICNGNHEGTTQGHICYRDADAAWLAETPWIA